MNPFDLSTIPACTMPAEWEPQEAVLLSWPLNPATWPTSMPVIQQFFAGLVATISRFQSVIVLCQSGEQARVQALIVHAGADVGNVTLLDVPTNDVWCRDHGPVFVRERDSGRRAMLDFTFNAWGGKFEPWNLDNEVPTRLAEYFGGPRHVIPCIGEGGGIEVNGRGILLNTESVWLNANRNPGVSRDAFDALFAHVLGTPEICWLPDGLLGDDTDGHIDTLSRFVCPEVVVSCSASDPQNPNHAAMTRNSALLREFGAKHQFEVVDMPLPDPIRPNAWREEILPATYANFLFINGALLVPTYRQPANDQRALDLLGDLVPDRKIVGIDCLDLVLEGGALHCLSQQVPVLSEDDAE